MAPRINVKQLGKTTLYVLVVLLVMRFMMESVLLKHVKELPQRPPAALSDGIVPPVVAGSDPEEDKLVALLNSNLESGEIAKQLGLYIEDRPVRGNSPSEITRCVVSHKYKTVFMHVFKSGGSAFMNTLVNLTCTAAQSDGIPCDDYVIQNHGFSKCDFASYDDYFVFTFVRNPWERLVSAWGYACSKLQQIGAPEDMPKGFCPFERVAHDPDTLRDCSHGSVSRAHWRWQHDFVIDKYGQVAFDFIGRLEHTERDFAYIIKRMSENDQDMNDKSSLLQAYERIGLLIHNAIEHKHYSAYFTPDTLRSSSQWYASDVAFFGYIFENRTATSEEGTHLPGNAHIPFPSHAPNQGCSAYLRTTQEPYEPIWRGVWPSLV